MPKKEIHYTEVVCDRCGKKIVSEENFAYKYRLFVTRYTQLYFCKLWTHRADKPDLYLCDDCTDDFGVWLDLLRGNDGSVKNEAD